jgi:hypothetical protein
MPYLILTFSKNRLKLKECSIFKNTCVFYFRIIMLLQLQFLMPLVQAAG